MLTSQNTSYKKPLVIPLLIFIGGFTNNIIPTLVLYIKNYGSVPTWQAVLLQSIIFISFLITMLPSTLLIRKYGYKFSISTACMISSFALLLLATVVQKNQYAAIFPCTFLLAIGITQLRISITPLLINLQGNTHYSQTVSKIMCADTVGALISPIISAYWVLSSTAHSEGNWHSETTFFTLMSVTFFIIALLCRRVHFTDSNSNPNINMEALKKSLRIKSIQKGSLSTFIFIGLEFAIPTFIGIYVNDSLAIQTTQATTFISAYWTLLLIGRIMSFQLLKIIHPQEMIKYGSIIAVTIILLSMLSTAQYLPAILTTLGLLNSFMFPCIFAIHTKKLEPETHFYASSIFLMAFSGGAVIPFLQALTAKQVGITGSFGLIVACYLALIWQTHKNSSTSLGQETSQKPAESTYN